MIIKHTRKLLAILSTAALLLGLAACKDETYNVAEDFPDGIFTLSVVDVGVRGGAYYAVVEPTDGSGARLTFKLAEDFTAQAFEPGVDGAIYMLDYYSPKDFYTQWYRMVKELGGLETAFSFVFAGDELISLTDTVQASPPDGPPMDEEQAVSIAVELLKAQMGEGMTLFPKCEGEVNGQHAFLIDLGMNTQEKFTAEEHYAVADDGTVWLLDILSNEWQPAAAG